MSHKPAETGGFRLAQVAGDYQKAAKADGVAITKYGEKDWDENYAHAYAMFIAEPATMKLLRPKRSPGSRSSRPRSSRSPRRRARGHEAAFR